MKTLKFKIKGLSEEDKQFIKELQINYSVSFRKAYNNLELLHDPAFLSSLKLSSEKQIEYLRKEVLTFEERNLKNKERILGHIKNLEGQGELTEKEFKRLQRLRKSYKRKVVFGGRKEIARRAKGLISSEEWRQKRLLPLVFYGQAASYGNRFFDLKDIASGNIIFKMENSKRKVPFNISTKKHSKEIAILHSLINNKEIPVTAKICAEYFQITFDEAIAYGTKHDLKAFYKTIRGVKDKETRKALIQNEHKRYEAGLKKDKKDRYLAIDLNPDGTGYCIIDKNVKVLKHGYIDISKVVKGNKRKYETSIMVKKLFSLMRSYKCHTVILEDLSIEPKNNGSKKANRKINNLWNQAFIKQIINRRCNEEGILKIEINPVYTSFIGNILNDYYDPVASAIEIGRRGIKKYVKGGFYPEFCIADIFNEWMYEDIKGRETWKGLYQLFSHSGWSYRRKLKNFSFSGYAMQSKKSKVKNLAFL